MNYLKGKKLLLILISLTVATMLLTLRLVVFLRTEIIESTEMIIMVIIALISIFVIFLTLLPKEMKLKEYINKYRDIIYFATFIYFNEFIFIIKNQHTLSLFNIFSLGLMISILCTIFLMVPKKLKSTFILFILIGLPIYMIAQDVYFGIFKDFFSFKEVVTIREGLESSEGVIHFKFIHFFYLLMSISSIFIYRILKQDNRIQRNKQGYKILYKPLILLIVFNLNAGYPVNTARLHLSDHYLYSSLYSNKMFISRYGTANYFTRDLAGALTPNFATKKDIKDINNYFTSHVKVHEDNEYSGIFEGKNLIFIMAESYSYSAIDENLTPNIVRLQNEGLDFTNHFVPVYPRTTCDSEIIYNTSIIPSVMDGPTCYMFNDNSYSQSLANIFNNKGYNTSAFHNNHKEFYTRYLVYDGLGYDSFYGQNELKLSEEEKRYDSVFFDTAKDLIVREDENFLSYVITISGHSPFTSSNLASNRHYEMINDYLGDDVDNEIKNYLAAEIEVDLLVGKLFEDLENKGLLDDTVIIFTTDHYPYTITSEKYEDYTNISEEYLKNQSPFFIWSKDIEPKKIDKLTSSFDVLPTIANMFNMDVDYTYYMGNDVFTDNYQPIVYFKDYSWYDGENYVSFGELKKGSADQSYIDQTTQSINRYFDISRKILRADYFNNQKQN